MDPVLTMPEGRSGFGVGLSEQNLWTFLRVSAPELARGKLQFEVFSSVRWPAWGGGVVALHFPGQIRTIWVKTLLWADGLAASWSTSTSLREPGWGRAVWAGVGQTCIWKAAEAIRRPWNEKAEGLNYQPPPSGPKPSFLVLTGCKVLLVMYCTERVNWSVTVLYCMKTHELPCIVSNGLYHVPSPPIPSLSPGFPNDACYQLGPPNSLVLTLLYPMVLLRMLTDDMPIQSLKFTTSLLSVCMKSTHTRTLTKEKTKDKLEFVSKHHWQSNVFYVCFYLGWLF